MATMKQVAEKARVSMAVVSRVLNQDESFHVPQKTREKVFAAAEQLGYTKKIKKSKKVFSVSLVQASLSGEESNDVMLLEMRRGIEDYCRKNAIAITRAGMGDSDIEEILKSTAGVLCIGMMTGKDMRKIAGMHNHVLFLNQKREQVPESASLLTFNCRDTADEIVGALVKEGRKKIALIGAPGDTLIRRAVISGLRSKKVLTEYFVREGSAQIDTGERIMADYLHEKDKPDAVLVSSDTQALGALRAINTAGLSVPDDVSVICFKDSQVCEFAVPAITALKFPAYEMGIYGAELLHSANKWQMHIPLRGEMSGLLVRRDSSSF